MSRMPFTWNTRLTMLHCQLNACTLALFRSTISGSRIRYLEKSCGYISITLVEKCFQKWRQNKTYRYGGYEYLIKYVNPADVVDSIIFRHPDVGRRMERYGFHQPSAAPPAPSGARRHGMLIEPNSSPTIVSAVVHVHVLPPFSAVFLLQRRPARWIRRASQFFLRRRLPPFRSSFCSHFGEHQRFIVALMRS